MLKINRLRIRLPNEFQPRAKAIARLVGEHLGRQSVSQSANYDKLVIPELRIRRGESNGQIAERIARGIHHGIESGPSHPMRSKNVERD